MEGVLAGRRIVVTRAPGQSAELTRALVERGASVEHLPLIAIDEPADGGVALADALGRIGTYEWLVVTSPNGAQRVAAALATASVAGRAPRVAAVGPATETALGSTAHLVPTRSSGAGLVAEFPRGVGRVLLAQGDRAGRAVAEGLRAKGWTVDVRVAYRTRALTPAADVVDRALCADAVVFASGSAVEGWVAAFGLASPPVVVAIGPSTASVAERQKLQVTRVAADQTVEGLVVALETALNDRR